MQAVLLFTVMVAAVLLVALDATRRGDGANKGALAQRHKEDVMLVAVGFKPDDGGSDLWRRDGVSYGREAALQCAWREWHKR
jgi:hypothetical protein